MLALTRAVVVPRTVVMSARVLVLSGLIALGSIEAWGQDARPEAAEPALADEGETAVVPYARSVDFQHLDSLTVSMSLNGGDPQAFQVDTGSTGIVVGASFIKNFDGKGEPGELTYSSSGVREEGVWTTIKIEFPGARMADGRPLAAQVKVLAVTHVEYTGKGVNSDRVKHSGVPSAHMLGIGFGRGKAETGEAQLRNPFVNLEPMVSGAMRRGYMITPGGIQLGLSRRTLGSGWTWEKLVPRGSGVPKDWVTAAGTFEVEGKRASMGTVLIDTGLTNMMIESPDFPSRGDLAQGLPVEIFLLGGKLSYSFNVGDSGQAATPRRVSWRPATRGVFVNTGLRALSLYDYCYDAEGGYLGLRARKKP